MLTPGTVLWMFLTVVYTAAHFNERRQWIQRVKRRGIAL